MLADQQVKPPRRPSALRRAMAEASGLPDRAKMALQSLMAMLHLAPVRQGPRLLAESLEGLTYRVATRQIGRASVALSLEGGTARILLYSGRRVIGWIKYELPDDYVRSGVVVDSTGCGTMLDNLFGRLGLPRGHVVSAVAGVHARSALLDLPWASDETLEETVADEAARVLGHNPDERYLFWQRLPGARRGRLVYALSVPRDQVLVAIESAQAAGLRLETLDLKPLALARAVNQRDAIIASVEPDALDVVIVVDDMPVYTKSVAIVSGFTSLSSIHERLVDEVVRSLSDHEDAAPGRPLDSSAPIFLCGSLADAYALGEGLAAKTGHAIGRIAPPMQYPSDFPLTEQLVNVGLALKGA